MEEKIDELVTICNRIAVALEKLATIPDSEGYVWTKTQDA